MNVLVGIAIGVVNTSWIAVLGSSLIWPFIFCGYVSILHAQRARTTIANFRERGRHFVFGSPVMTFYGIEFATALLTALPVALLTYLIKSFFT
jgi:hypothetical protein